MGAQSNKAFFNSEAAKNKDTWKNANAGSERTRVRGSNSRYDYATGLFQDVVHYQRPQMFPYLTATAEAVSDSTSTSTVSTAPITEVVSAPKVTTATVTEPVKTTTPEPMPVVTETATATKSPTVSTIPRYTTPVIAREVIVADPLPQMTTVLPSASRVLGSNNVLGESSFVDTNTINKKSKSYLWLLVLAGVGFGAYKILK